MRINEPETNNEVHFDANAMLVSKTDTKGIVTYCNQVFMDIVGFTEKEILGKPHNIVRHPDMPPEAFQDLWDTIRDGKEWRGIVKNRCANGDYYWVDATVTPSLGMNGQIIGYMSVRRKPTHSQVDEAVQMMRGESKSGRRKS